jgi:hypothetical protein
MLAQNFKTPAALRLTDAGFEVLLKLLGMLERKEIADNEFSMSTVRSECGTAACIKGWCQTISADKNIFSFFDPSSCGPTLELNKLFMYCDERRHSVTMEQAAMGLRNYLTFGDARWKEVLAE